MYLLGQAISQMSNSIPLVYANTNDPMNEHLDVTNSSYEIIFLPFIIVKSEHSSMSDN